jgi:hypothetical protein
MPRDIYEAQAQLFARGRDQIQVGEADIDRDTTPFFFLQAVGIDAGKRSHQRTFAMVNMTCGAYDDGLHATSVNNCK